VRTENTLLEDGMDRQGAECRRLGRAGLAGFIDKLDWMMPAGFYYKTMHKPAAIWPVAMKQIRKAAGLGVISADYKMKGQYDERYLKAEVTVIGGGAAGMAAALAAAESGQRVILLESRPHLGGCFDYRVSTTGDGTPLYQRARRTGREGGTDRQHPVLQAHRHGRRLQQQPDHRLPGGQSRDVFTERYLEIRSDSVVVATGCIERPLLFDTTSAPASCRWAAPIAWPAPTACCRAAKRSFPWATTWGWKPPSTSSTWAENQLCGRHPRGRPAPELLLALAERKDPGPQRLGGRQGPRFQAGRKGHPCHRGGHGQARFTCDLLVASAGLTPVTGPFILAQAKMGYDSRTGYFLPDRTAREDVPRRPHHRHQRPRCHRGLRPPGRPQGGRCRRC
jgi:sarcosine oxidase subunit alpha